MKEQLTEEQKKFLTAEGKVVVKACPGSGKTYSVAHKLLSYIDNWKDYHSGVAVGVLPKYDCPTLSNRKDRRQKSFGDICFDCHMKMVNY